MMWRAMILGATVLAAPLAAQSPAPSGAEVRMDPSGGNRVQARGAGGTWHAIGVIDPTGRLIGGESPQLHGADGRCTPGSDDTAAVQAFFDAVRDGGQGVMTGCFAVTEGQLVLSPSPAARLVMTGGFKTYAAPQLTGDATFAGRGTGHGPLLAIANPPQNSGSGSFYAGGTLGSVHFAAAPGAGPGDSGLLLQGVANWQIGQLTGREMGGPLLTLSRRTVDAASAFSPGGISRGDPDSYAAISNTIAAVVCSDCRSVSADLGTLADSGQVIGLVGAYGGKGGALVSAGQGTRIEHLAALGNRGWGAVYGAGPQHGNRQSVDAMELQNPENALWVGALSNSVLRGRINFTRGADGTIWPHTAIKIGGQRSLVSDVELHLNMRLDTPTTLADLVNRGTLIDLSDDPNIVAVRIVLTVVDNAGTGLIGRGGLSVPVDQIVRHRSPLADVSLVINGQQVLPAGPAPR